MSFLKKRLSESPSYVLAVYASVFLFITYTCTYALRKPFAAGLYEGEVIAGFDAKVLYVLAEIIGYACSKFIGVRVLPGLRKERRAWFAVGLMAFSELSLAGFGLFPPSLKVFMLFLSGLPLGMIWGILFSYIEGRKISGVLNVGVSITLIISSGAVKTFGQSVMDTFQVSEYWMPSLTGALCFPVMLASMWLLDQIPEPNEEDKLQRTERTPMSRKECLDFLRKFFPGIVMLVAFYGALTVFRELRDSFAADIWNELHVSDSLIFTKTEVPICLVVFALMLSLSFIRSNRWAVNFIYAISMLGGCILLASTWCYTQGWISPVGWMVSSGLGMYMGYIPFSFLIDRLIALLRVVSTMVFLLYLADSAGYLGTALVFMLRNFMDWEVSWTSMLVCVAYAAGLASVVLIYLIFRYFRGQIVRIVRQQDGKAKDNLKNDIKK